MADLKRFPIDLNLIAEAFDIQRNEDCTYLDNWLKADYQLDEIESYLFQILLQKTKKDGNYWNEEELKVHLIGPLFLISKVEVEQEVKIFYERPLSAEIDEYYLSVIADCLIAKPMVFNKPKKPYFFLQEYKKGRGDDKDPEAQMLMAMIISQHLNQDEKPLYGSYVIGNQWVFATLRNNIYCTSESFNASDAADLHKIVSIIRKLKEIVL